jgi:hypothetical protein
MIMLNPLFAYFGPDTFLPLASIVGAIGGAMMLFGRTIVRAASRTMRLLLRKAPRVHSPSPQASRDPS